MRQRVTLAVVGVYVWLMMLLLGSIMLETFMVYPNIFHDPPASLTTALSFMKVRAPSDFYPAFGFLSWVVGAVSTIAAWRTPSARRWMLLSLSMILSEGLLSMVCGVRIVMAGRAGARSRAIWRRRPRYWRLTY